ncbi:MAG: SIMPL domain-containing protein [Candidatus Saccharimonadales bacterium]
MAQTKGSLTLTFDYRWVAAVLLLIIVVMLALWRPWQPRYDAQTRTIDASGEATVKAVPDQYVFYPVYTFKDADKTAALDASTKKTQAVVDGLKKLGVNDTAIKTAVNGYQDGMYNANSSSGGYVYSVSLTITLTDKDVSQKVQDYLVTTSPEGSVSPQPMFSDAKRKELEKTAREAAAKDARSKAEQLAKDLGGQVGDVKSITDGAGFGGVMPMYDKAITSVAPASGSLTLQPGENELNYTVTVVYYLR